MSHHVSDFLIQLSCLRPFYHSDVFYNRHQANFRVFDPLDILAEVTAHIPDVHEQTTLFDGWYSNRMRGYRRRHGLLAEAEAADPVPGTDDRAPLAVRRPWARLVRQVYEVDPLLWPCRGGRRAASSGGGARQAHCQGPSQGWGTNNAWQKGQRFRRRLLLGARGMRSPPNGQ